MNNIPTIIQLLQSKMEVYADPVILKINQPTPPDHVSPSEIMI